MTDKVLRATRPLTMTRWSIDVTSALAEETRQFVLSQIPGLVGRATYRKAVVVHSKQSIEAYLAADSPDAREQEFILKWSAPSRTYELVLDASLYFPAALGYVGWGHFTEGTSAALLAVTLLGRYMRRRFADLDRERLETPQDD